MFDINMKNASVLSHRREKESFPCSILKLIFIHITDNAHTINTFFIIGKGKNLPLKYLSHVCIENPLIIKKVLPLRLNNVTTVSAKYLQ